MKDICLINFLKIIAMFIENFIQANLNILGGTLSQKAENLIRGGELIIS
jgi:hypothetical protein